MMMMMMMMILLLCVKMMDEAKDSVTSVHVSDHEILSGSADCQLRLYDLRNGLLHTDYIGCKSVTNTVRGAATTCPRPCKLTFDLLTLKVVSESRVTWATCVPILVFLGLSVLDLGPMYATDRQTSDAHHRLIPPALGGEGIIRHLVLVITDV